MIDLFKIKDPSFLKNLNHKELKQLAEQIREFLIDSVSDTGGHLASNLGVVELTIALHYVFDSPNDKLLFDVGHQSYVHKILTGRAKEFSTLRKFGGLSGYISKSESEHDVFESGHSSTSISTQLGMLYATKGLESNNHVVSIIGDASIVNGVSFEALNITTETKTNPIVILNDNKMGISRSVGSVNKELIKIRKSKFYRSFKGINKVIFPIPVQKLIGRCKRGIKGVVQRANIFEDLGYHYSGPYNGNNIMQVIQVLQYAKKLNKPVLIHLITKKGLGYQPAQDDIKGDFHGVSKFDKNLGLVQNTDNSFSTIFAECLIKERANNEFKVICPAMLGGTKLDLFAEKYPNDIIDVGIAEELAVSMASGIALQNKNVVVAMYSTFAQRAYDYFLNDIARQNLKVLIGLDRAGIVGPDGSTHQGVYDVAMFSSMPNMKIAMPMNDVEMNYLIQYYFKQNNPMLIRYPKANVEDSKDYVEEIIDESWYYLKNNNNKTCVLSYGPDLLRIKKIVEENNFDIDIVNALFLKPLDLKMINDLLNYDNIIVYEQIVLQNSLGSNLLYELYKLGFRGNFEHMCLKVDDYLVHGDIPSVLKKYKLGDDDILEVLKKCV